MKKIISIVLGLATISITVSAQTTELFVGGDANSFVIAANETFHVNGLTLTPSTALDLTNSSSTRQIIKASTVSNTIDNSRTYVPVVFRFSNTVNSFTGTVRINYADGDLTGFTESQLKFHYHNGSDWNADAGSQVDETNNFVTSSALSNINLNEMVLTNGTVVLPVTWLDFTAQRQPDHVLLQWSTASEINTEDFVVQHSLNAADWASLGAVDAAGNSNVTNRYSYIHHSPVKSRNAINYYRILQRDIDGKFSYSKILSLRYDDATEEVLVYPNPAVSTLTLYLPTAQQVRLVNAQGAVVWQAQVAAGRNQVQVSHLAKGVYYLITADSQHPIVIQ